MNKAKRLSPLLLLVLLILAAFQYIVLRRGLFARFEQMREELVRDTDMYLRSKVH